MEYGDDKHDQSEGARLSFLLIDFLTNYIDQQTDCCNDH